MSHGFKTVKGKSKFSSCPSGQQNLGRFKVSGLVPLGCRKVFHKSNCMYTRQLANSPYIKADQPADRIEVFFLLLTFCKTLCNATIIVWPDNPGGRRPEMDRCRGAQYLADVGFENQLAEVAFLSTLVVKMFPIFLFSLSLQLLTYYLFVFLVQFLLLNESTKSVGPFIQTHERYRPSQLRKS